MGLQSSRLYFQGNDHKDVYFKGNFHTAMYYGKEGGYIWRKLNIPSDGDVPIFDICLCQKNRNVIGQYQKMGFCVLDVFNSVEIRSAYSTVAYRSERESHITQGQQWSIVYGIEGDINSIYITKDGRSWNRKVLSRGYTHSELETISVMNNGFATNNGFYHYDGENITYNGSCNIVRFASGVATDHTFGRDALGNIYKITPYQITKILEGSSIEFQKDGDLYFSPAITEQDPLHTYATRWNHTTEQLETTRSNIDIFGQVYITKEQKFVAYYDGKAYESNDCITWVEKNASLGNVTPNKVVGNVSTQGIGYESYYPRIDKFGRFSDVGSYFGHSGYVVNKGEGIYYFNDAFFNSHSCELAFNPNEYGIDNDYYEGE